MENKRKGLEKSGRERALRWADFLERNKGIVLGEKKDE